MKFFNFAEGTYRIEAQNGRIAVYDTMGDECIMLILCIESNSDILVIVPFWDAKLLHDYDKLLDEHGIQHTRDIVGDKVLYGVTRAI